MIELKSCAVRVPCSTSNLGSGFDTIGLALDRYLDASFEPGGDTLAVERVGTLTRLADESAPDLAATLFRETVEAAGAAAHGRLRLDSSIPVARGLGASGAAILAGYDLAKGALGSEPDPAAAFRAALRHEGHGDNIAPSLFGGLQAVVTTADGPVVTPLRLHSDVGFAYAAPAAGTSTSEARGLLPEQVPHRLAARALGRLAALIRGLAECDPELIRLGMKDELHVPYRLPLIPSSAAAMAAATDAGAWAVTISGAGSGLVALCDPADAAAVADAMHTIFDAGSSDPECVGFEVRPCMEGLVRIAG